MVIEMDYAMGWVPSKASFDLIFLLGSHDGVVAGYTAFASASQDALGLC